MSTYFDQVPHELIINILSHIDMRNTSPFIYFKDILESNWRYLFALMFPDLNLDYLEHINYKYKEFEYMSKKDNYYLIIYKKIFWAYKSALDFINYNKLIKYEICFNCKNESSVIPNSMIVTRCNQCFKRFEFFHTSIRNTELFYLYFKEILEYLEYRRGTKIKIHIQTTIDESLENFKYTLIYQLDGKPRGIPLSYKECLNVITNVSYND